MILALALVVATAAAAPAPAALGWTASRASISHPRVLLAPRPEARRAALVVRFGTGSADDEEAPGLARATQHVLVEANRRMRYRDLVLRLRAAGARLGFETSLAESSFWLEAGREDFGRLAAVVLDQLLSPEIDPRAFERAMESARHDEREGDGRDDLALIASKVVDDPTFGNPPSGTEAGLELIDAGQIQRQLSGPFSPANATVVLAGGFDVAQARRLLARYAGGRETVRTRPPLSTPFSLQIPARREVYLVAYRAAFDTPERVAVARLAAALAEERIEWFFRDRGVGYSQSVEPVHRSWIDLLVVTLPAHDPSGVPLAGLLEEELAAVPEGRFSDADFERNRAWVLARLARTDADALSLATTLALGGGDAWFGPEVARAARSLDRASFLRAAAELFDERASIRVLYTPRASARGAIPEAYRHRSGAR